MEKTINIKIEEIKNELFNIVNNSGLPFSAIYYLFKDFMNDLTNAYNETLNNEYQRYKEEEQKESENENEEDIDEEEE